MDVLAIALGEVFAQKEENSMIYSVEYMIRTMKATESCNATCEREALAGIFYLRNFMVLTIHHVVHSDNRRQNLVIGVPKDIYPMYVGKMNGRLGRIRL